MNKILKLILFSILIFISTFSHSQKKYAVVVGINMYYDSPGKIYNSVLRGCVNDALAIKGMLIQLFDFNTTDIKVFTNETATRSNVLNELNSLLKIVKPGDVLFFYFSGHGVWISNAWQSPIDKKIKEGMNQAMVMADLYSDNYNCLFTDALVKKTFNKFVDKKVIVTSVFDCCFSGKIVMSIDAFRKAPYYYMNPNLTEKSISLNDIPGPTFLECELKPDGCNKDSINTLMMKELFEDTASRSFNMNNNIRIDDSTYIKPPSERKGSMFLSLSASSDYQKSIELKDEAGLYHGAFTKALLQTMNSNDVAISVKDIFNSISTLLLKKSIVQTPMHFEDPQRLNRNLIGVSTPTGIKKPKAIVNSVAGNEIILKGSIYDGFSPGNILSLNGNEKILKIELVEVDTNRLKAKLINGNQSLIKPGSVFIRTNEFIATKPLIKLCINSVNGSPAVFSKFFDEQVKPLVNRDGYWDYENWYITEPSRNIFFKDFSNRTNPMLQNSLMGVGNEKFFAYLPIPTYIISEAKKLLERDQNIQVVNSSIKADYTLYLNYVKGEKPGYVFTWYNFRNEEVNSTALQLLPYRVKIPSMQITGQALQDFATEIHEMTLKLLHKKTGRWLNDMPARNILR